MPGEPPAQGRTWRRSRRRSPDESDAHRTTQRRPGPRMRAGACGLWLADRSPMTRSGRTSLTLRGNPVTYLNGEVRVMRVVIVYESLFGNTRQVAEAIAEGIREAVPEAQVSCVRATEANRDVALGADLLVVGGPTHLCGLSSGVSRRIGAARPSRWRRPGKPGIRWSRAPRGPVSATGSWPCPRPPREPGRGVRHPPGLPDGGHARRTASRAGSGGTATNWSPSPRASSSTTPTDRCGGGEQDRAREWGANLLRQPVR